jgi:hypothetical protein
MEYAYDVPLTQGDLLAHSGPAVLITIAILILIAIAVGDFAGLD